MSQTSNTQRDWTDVARAVSAVVGAGVAAAAAVVSQTQGTVSLGWRVAGVAGGILSVAGIVSLVWGAIRRDVWVVARWAILAVSVVGAVYAAWSAHSEGIGPLSSTVRIIPWVGIAIVTYLFGTKKREVGERAEGRPESKIVQEVFNESTLFSAESRRELLKFDEDGSGQLVSEHRGITTDQYLSNLSIPLHVETEYEDANLKSPEVERLVPTTEVEIANLPPLGTQKLMTTIVVKGPVHPRSNRIHYRTVLPFKKLFPMTKEEAERVHSEKPWKGPELCCGVRAPTKVLEFKIEFPASWSSSWDRISTFPIAISEWDPKSQIRNEETDRIRTGFESIHPDDDPTVVRPTASLEVTDPKPLLMYGIAWSPPD